MSRSQCPRAVAVSPLRCLTIIMIVIAVLCLLSLPMSVSASALADDASGSSNSLLHTFKVAREARLKNQPGPIDININININNNNNNDDEDEDEQHTNDNNQNTAIVFPAETSNAMWEFQTTPRPPQPTTGQAEEQLSSLMAQNEDVDSRRTPFQDLIQQLRA